ncbi:MAG: tetratricopeptide repeat protein [Nitrospirota bacterium]
MSEVIEAYKQAIQIQPDHADAHMHLGFVYIMLNDTGSALDTYRMLKDINPKMANKLFNLIYREIVLNHLS